MKHLFRREDIAKKDLKGFKNSRLKFPVNFWCKEGGEFLGDLFTDGAFQKDGCVTYANSEIDNILSNLRSVNKLFSGRSLKIEKIKKQIAMLTEPNEIAKKLNDFVKNFGIHCNVRFRNKTKIFEIRYSRILRIFLDKLGIERGEKVLINPKLPNVIVKAPLPVVSSFLRRVISNEGTVTQDGQICIRQAIASFHRSPKLLEGYRKLFGKFGIKTTKPRVSKKYKGKYGTHIAWEIYTRPYDIQKILHKIRIETIEKQIKAKKFLMNAKRFKLPREERIKQIVYIALKLNKPFTIYEILKLTDLRRSALQDYLYRLMEKGLIIRSKREFYPSGSKPFFYQLTKKGEEFANNTNSF